MNDELQKFKDAKCIACSGSGGYCGGPCGACNGTGLEHTPEEVFAKLEEHNVELQKKLKRIKEIISDDYERNDTYYLITILNSELKGV